MSSRPEKTAQGELASEFMLTDSHTSVAFPGGNEERRPSNVSVRIGQCSWGKVTSYSGTRNRHPPGLPVASEPTKTFSLEIFI